ncbi:hypothetical protein GCM10023213_44600 [Prosthecobacter algae]|uniref:Uncharacterized protein n=1 Tax=Prosthecobacter algae TaxID=1144682 RepID=A0ABP9PKZ2_9BACT
MGSWKSEMAPRMKISSESTPAKMGRVMKNRERFMDGERLQSATSETEVDTGIIRRRALRRAAGEFGSWAEAEKGRGRGPDDAQFGLSGRQYLSPGREGLPQAARACRAVAGGPGH